MKRLCRFLALGYLIFVAACASGSTPTVLGTPTVPVLSPTLMPTPAPTQQSVPGGTVLYQSDWSKGLRAWGGSAGWRIVNGIPQSDLRKQNVLTTPYQLKVPNYAFEFRFQIVSVPQNGGSFVLKAKRTQDKTGYVAGILNLLSPAPHSDFANPQVRVYLDPIDATDNPGSANPSDYRPGTVWHTFRVEVRGPRVNFFTDGTSKGNAMSSKTAWLSNGPLQLISSGAIVRISSVRILAL